MILDDPPETVPEVTPDHENVVTISIATEGNVRVIVSQAVPEGRRIQTPKIHDKSKR